MSWTDSTRKDREIRDRLRREAQDGRAEFSDALHQRICQAIQECDVSPSPAADDLVPRRRMTRGWRVTAAAACLAVAATIAWQAFRSDPGSPRPVDRRQMVQSPPAGELPVPQLRESPTVPPMSYPAPAGILVAMDRTIASSQWAYLDHDARTAVRLFAQVLLFEPTPAQPSR